MLFCVVFTELEGDLKTPGTCFQVTCSDGVPCGSSLKKSSGFAIKSSNETLPGVWGGSISDLVGWAWLSDSSSCLLASASLFAASILVGVASLELGDMVARDDGFIIVCDIFDRVSTTYTSLHNDNRLSISKKVVDDLLLLI